MMGRAGPGNPCNSQRKVTVWAGTAAGTTLECGLSILSLCVQLFAHPFADDHSALYLLAGAFRSIRRELNVSTAVAPSHLDALPGILQLFYLLSRSHDVFERNHMNPIWAEEYSRIKSIWNLHFWPVHCRTMSLTLDRSNAGIIVQNGPND